jgi:2-C-methyl-D-erythritol 4-phosphate cytidylyltransferase
LAAGSGKRTGLKYNKVLFEINGKKVLDYSIDLLKLNPKIDEIILVVSPNELDYFEKGYINRVDKVITGGAERQDSVYKALNEAKCGKLLIHDGARPFIPGDSLEELITKLEVEDSLTLGVKVKDTIQEVSGNRVTRTFDRSKLIITQTPQAFNKELLIKAHDLAIKDGFYGTDDTMLMEKYLDIKAYVIKGDYRNIKLTTLDDIKLLEVIL